MSRALHCRGNQCILYKKETHRKGGGGVRYSEADIQEFINDNDVKFIKFSFCDVFGSQKIISVLPSVLPRAFSQGIAVDASRIEGFYKRGDSELFLFPDTDTISLLPGGPPTGGWRGLLPHQGPGGQPLRPGRPENPAGRGGLGEDRGIEVNFGAENDFYLFRTDGGRGTPRTSPLTMRAFWMRPPRTGGRTCAGISA